MINTIRYMGSKRKILKEIYKIAYSMNKTQFIDLFSGSGVVSINAPFDKVVSNDIQKYTHIITQGSTLPFSKKQFLIIKTKMEKLVHTKKKGFIQKNYENKFFSSLQAKFLDELRTLADKSSDNILIKYIGIKMMFIMQNSPGHFASFLKKSERSKKLLSKDPFKILEHVYENWEFNNKKITSVTKKSEECIIYKNAIYYMDPPYTTDQYSRFYHLLETFVLNDNPKLLDNKSRYREDRYKSNFSNRKFVKIAFINHFKKISAMNSNLILSYYYNGLVSIDDLKTEMKKYFKIVKIKKIKYKHSSLGGKPRKTKEILMWGTNG